MMNADNTIWMQYSLNTLKDMKDYDLARECMNGNQDAFSELISRYKNLVYSVILRMVNDNEEANDLAQEVFIKIYKNLDKYSAEFKFSTWIMKIATNHVIDYRRKRKFDTIQIEDIANNPSFKETPEEICIRKERNMRVMDAVSSLPDMYKTPVILYHQHGLSYQDIADIIDEPLSKVKNRIFRARKMLKESLSAMKEGNTL